MRLNRLIFAVAVSALGVAAFYTETGSSAVSVYPVKFPTVVVSPVAVPIGHGECRLDLPVIGPVDIGVFDSRAVDTSA